MATSGVTTLTFTASDLISEAFSILGVKAQGDALIADEAAAGLTSLNLMTLSWATRRHLWFLAEGTITPVAGQASYTLSPVPVDVTSVRRRITSGGTTNDLPLERYSREDYYDLPNKTAGGAPLGFYYDRQRATGSLVFWQVPDASFVSASGSMPYTYARRMEVVTNPVQDLDWPQEWFETLSWNLARRMLTKYPANGQYTAEEIKAQAAEMFAGLSSYDQETGSVFLQPSYQGGS